jgi:hypothetical protein
MFFDKSVNFTMNADRTSILPAEALLAAIEVKSVLTKDEILKSAQAARKLRELKPFGKPLGGKNVGSLKDGASRYYYCIFAYDTDLSIKTWLSHEQKRIYDVVDDEHLIDIIYVVERGLLNISYGRGRMEDNEGGSILEFYSSVLNFIQREARRREPAPFLRYASPPTNAWVKLANSKEAVTQRVRGPWVMPLD